MPARLIDVQAGEGPSLLRIGMHNLVGSAATTIHLSVAEAHFLNSYPASHLPYPYLIGAFVATFAGLAYEALQRRLGSRLLGALVIGALAILLLAAIFDVQAERKVAPYLLLITSSLSGVLISIENGELWGRLWDVRTARRLLPVVGALGNLGVVVGGVLVAGLSRRFQTDGLMWISFSLILCTILPAHGARSGARPPAILRKASWSTLGRHRLAVVLLASIFMAGLLSTVVRYQLGAQAQVTLPPARTAGFFGLLNAGLSAGLVLFQPFLARPLIRRLPLGLSLGLYPAGVLVAAALSLIHPGLSAATAFFFGERLLRLSFNRPAIQVAILPLPDAVRLRTSVAFRNALETFAVAAGSAAMLALPHGLHVHELAAACIVMCVGGLVAAIYVNRDYVRELASALQARRLRTAESLDPAPVETTVRRVLHEQMEGGVSEKAALALRLLEGRFTPESLALVRRKWPAWDPWTKIRAVHSLSNRPIPDAVAFLRALGPEEPEAVRAALIRSRMTELTDEELDRLLEAAPPVLRAEAMILGLGRGRIDRVRAILESWIAAEDSNLRREAAYVIGEAKDDALLHLLPDLASVAPIEVAAAVSQRPTAQFTELCIKFLSDDRTFARARDALVKIGAPARQALLAAVRHPDLSAPALRVLGEIEDPDCRRGLLDLLSDPDDELRFHAAKALSRRPAVDEDEHRQIGAALEAEWERCRRQAALRSHPEPLIRDEAAANFETALERLFVLLSLLHPGAPMMRAFLSYVSPDPRQRGFALEMLDGILAPVWKSRLLPFLENPESASRGVRAPLDPSEQRIVDALANPSHDPVLGRAMELKAIPIFGGWRLRDLEPLALVSIEPGMATSDTRLVFQAGRPVEFERTIVHETTPAVDPNSVIGFPLSEVYEVIRLQPRCGSLWLRALASRFPGPTGERPDVSRTAVSLGMRRVAQDSQSAGGTGPWERLFFLRSVPLFSELSPERLWLVAEIARPVSIAKGEEIVREGHSGQHLYLICSGQAEVTKGGKPVTVLRELEAFGEFSLLTGEPRSATVRAIERCDLLRIARADFLDLMDTNPSLVKPFSKMIAQRVLGAGKP